MRSGSRGRRQSWVLVIECRNDGRTATRVHGLWLRGADGTPVRCQRSETSPALPTTVPGMDMAVWTIAASTLKNLDLPRATDGALVVQPEIKWGAGRVLSGNEFALLLPAEGLTPFPDSGPGKPTVTVDPPPEETKE